MRLYHSRHGDQTAGRQEEIGLVAFHRGAKHKGGTPNIVLLLPRGVDRGSQRAVLQP